MKSGKSYFFNTLDWYITKKVLSTFVVAIMLISFIIIMFDFSTKLDDFIDHQAPMRAVIFDYYLNFVPFYVNMFGDLFFFISVVYVTSRLTARSEIVAILCGGISFGRMLRPFVVCSILVGLFGLYVSNFLMPQVSVNIYEFQQKYYRNKYVNSFVNIHIQANDSTQVYVHHFDNSSAQGFLFTKEIFSNDKVKEKIAADAIRYDSITNKWTMQNFSIRKVNDKNEELTYGSNQVVDLSGLKPNDFNKILQVNQLDFNQLNQTIERERMKGSQKVRELYVEKYSRLISPINYIILTLIAVSLSSKKTRGGMGKNLAIGIALAFTLILMMKILKASATNGTLLPILAPIIPIAIFSLIAAYLLKIAPK